METKICQFLCTHQNYAYIYASGGALKKRYGLYDLFYNCAFLQVNHAIIDTCQPRLCFIYYKDELTDCRCKSEKCGTISQTVDIIQLIHTKMQVKWSIS